MSSCSTLFMRAFFICAMATAMANMAHAQEKAQEMVPDVNILRGDFEQIRTLKGFKNPLRSEGHFLVSKHHGVVWQTTKPFSSLILIRNSGVIVNLDRPTTKMVNKPNRNSAAVSKIILAMLLGDSTSIAKHFTIQRTESNGVWMLQLRPKGSMMRVFNRVVIHGERYIHDVVLEEKNGDESVLRFINVSEAPEYLTADELKYFK